jgi:hypothetical protein
MFLTEGKDGVFYRPEKNFFRRFKPIIGPACKGSSTLPFTQNNVSLQGIQLVDFTVQSLSQYRKSRLHRIVFRKIIISTCRVERIPGLAAIKTILMERRKCAFSRAQIPTKRSVILK